MLKIVHKTSKRVRLRCDQIGDKTDVKHLEISLENIEQISKASVNPTTKSLVLFFHGDFAALLEKIEKFPFANYQKKASSSEIKADFTPVVYSSLALGASMLSSNNTTKALISTFATSPLLTQGVKDLFSSGITSRFLEATAVGVSLARGNHVAANSTNALIALGEYIEESSVYKSDELIKALARPNASYAWLEVRKGKEVEEVKVATKDIKVGDIVIVNMGDTIPVDGHVLSHNALVNQISMTGEAEPIKKSRGDKVMSGTIIEEGRLRIWAEHVGEDTATERIKKYIQSSLNEKSALGLKASALADKLVPVTLGLSFVAYMLNRDFESVASVLQADYSCALRLATPVAFKSAISQAGEDGILIKGAKSLESLSKVDTIVFDKTGTLTYGKLEVQEVYSFDPAWSKERVLNLTASTEEHYFHPVAQAVVEAAKENGFVHIHHEEVKFIVAHGVKTLVNEKEVLIGSRHFLEDDEHVDFSSHEQKIQEYINSGKTLLYIAYDGKLLGIIAMVDKLRTNAKQTLQKLKSLGIKELVMLTGDVEEKAQDIANQVGIDTVYANLLPTQKAAKVKELKEQGRNIAFVGDGINDAPALISALVGISMSKGADIAKASADISLLKDDIYSIAQIKELADKTLNRIDKHFKATVGINSAILLAATSGVLSPISTAILHNSTTIALLANSLRKIKLD